MLWAEFRDKLRWHLGHHGYNEDTLIAVTPPERLDNFHQKLITAVTEYEYAASDMPDMGYADFVALISKESYTEAIIRNLNQEVLSLAEADLRELRRIPNCAQGNYRGG